MATEAQIKANRENAKRGGRKKGSLSQTTLDRMKVDAAFRQRVLTHADALFNAQLNLATGVTHVYRIDETGEGKNKKREHILVTDPDEIKELLDEHDGGDGVVGENYYYITTKDPSNIAVDSLLNRGMGKPTENVDLTSKGERLSTVDDETKKMLLEFETKLRKNIK